MEKNLFNEVRDDVTEKMLTAARQHDGDTIDALEAVGAAIDIVYSFAKRIDDGELKLEDVKKAHEYLAAETEKIAIDGFTALFHPRNAKGNG